MLYLEIHNEKDGVKTFSANTRYDWYVLHNINYGEKTEIKDEDGIITTNNINIMRFIPNSKFEIITSLTSSNIKVDIIHSESAYEPRKKWMSSIKNDEYKYPCIYSINKNNTPSFKYSNINDKGHFGISKVIWGGGATGFILDENGDYGLTQWASAITDDKIKLKLIKKALESNTFNNIIKSISVSKQEINYKILKEFNKNFYDTINKMEENIIKNGKKINDEKPKKIIKQIKKQDSSSESEMENTNINILEKQKKVVKLINKIDDEKPKKKQKPIKKVESSEESESSDDSEIYEKSKKKLIKKNK